ncbi:MAG: GNAT family N-acetyltransferase, partial [candidate division WOR-3 bacterium]
MVSGTEQQPELRLFRPDDLGAVQAVIFRTIDACYAEVYPPQALAFFKEFHSKENILEDSGQGHTFVLEVDGRIVGAGGLSKATIKRVFVDPEFQHRGLGQLMMARLEEQARERGVTTVDLDASLPSKRFYDFLGYQGDEL